MEEKMSVRDSSPRLCLHSVFLHCVLGITQTVPFHGRTCVVFLLQSPRKPRVTRQEAESVPESSSPRRSIPRRQISRHPAEQCDPQHVLCRPDSEGEETEILETFTSHRDAANPPRARVDEHGPAQVRASRSTWAGERGTDFSLSALVSQVDWS